MTAPARVPLGASTTQRKWYVDVNTGTHAVPAWTPVAGITNLDFNPDDANWEDDSDFDSQGFGSDTKSGAKWGATLTLARKSTVADVTEYDAGQEFLRGKAIGKFGVANSVEVRIYEMEPDGPRAEAYFGQAGVQWAPQGGSETALVTVQCTLNGQGELASIDHPDTAAAVVAVLSSVTPSTLATAGGDLVAIRGNGFAGTTGAGGVKFGVTNATHYTVENDNLIYAVAPAHSAGSAAVSVTNPVGASTVNVNVTYA